MEPNVECSYLGGHFVIVESQESIEEGCFGTSLDSTRRKEAHRRGPVDKRLLSLSEKLSLDSSKPYLFLSLCEAFFLLHRSKRVVIRDDRSNGIGLMDVNSTWSTFREAYEKSIINTDFAIEYCVYEYFRSIGWIVKSGENYGANFLLYRKGPSSDHAQYAVILILDKKQPSWNTLISYHRVTQSVCKDLLLVYVREPSDLSEPAACISDMRLSFRVFVRHPIS